MELTFDWITMLGFAPIVLMTIGIMVSACAPSEKAKRAREYQARGGRVDRSHGGDPPRIRYPRGY